MDTKSGIAVIFDFNRTIYDPDTKGLFPDAHKVLKTVKERGIPMYLVSKADESRPQLLDELELRDYFVDTFFVEQKNPALFFEIQRHANVHPKDIYVVGDHLHKEIRCGNQCGMRTIWLKKGKFADLEPAVVADTPWKTISDLSESIDLIE